MRALAVPALLLLACSSPRPATRPSAEPEALSAEALGALARGYGDAGGAFGRNDWPAVAEALQRALEVNAGDDSLVYSVASAWAQAGRADDAYAWLERLVAMKSAMVPQARDFPGLSGERFTRVVKALEQNAPTPHAKVAFELAQRDLIAEGIAHDSKTGTFFVSSIHHRKVVAVRPDGSVTDFATGGLMSTLGMKVDAARRQLWVASAFTPSMKDARPEEQGRAALHVYDVDGGRELARYPRGGDGKPHLLNDVTIARDGTVYVTDSEAGEVLRLAPGAKDFEVLVPSGSRAYPNGIALSDDDTTLFFADFVQGLSRVGLATGKVSVVGHPRGVATHGFDGLYFHDGALVGVENGSGPGRVVRLTLAPELDRVVRADVLEAAHPLSEIPTTGVIADGALHLIVNSQLRAFKDGKILPWEQLQPVRVVKVPLAR